MACDSDVALKFKETKLIYSILPWNCLLKLTYLKSFSFFVSAYTEKGVKVRLLIFVYESQSTFHSWRENTEQLLTSVTLSVLAPLPGRKENTCRVCLYALAGSVTLSFTFFSIFEFCNANRTDLPTTIWLLRAALTPTLVCQQRTWGWGASACSCFPVGVGSGEGWHADVSLRAGGGCWIHGMPCKDLFLTLDSGFGCNNRV